jgi:hypothetical protein
LSPHTLIEVCSVHKDKVEIKCMGSVGGKTPTKLEIYLSSNLGHNKIDIIHIVHSYHGWEDQKYKYDI